MGWDEIYLDYLAFSGVVVYTGGSKNPGYIGSWTNNSGAAISIVVNVFVSSGYSLGSETRVLAKTLESLGYFDNIVSGEPGRPDDANDGHLKTHEIIVYHGYTVDIYMNSSVSTTISGQVYIYKSQNQLLMETLDGVKAKSDLLNFTGTDVKATLDSEAVKLAADGWDGLSITEPAGDPDAWTVPQKLMWLVMRFMNKHTSDNYAGITVHKSDDTVSTSQPVTEVSGVKSVGKAQ